MCFWTCCSSHPAKSGVPLHPPCGTHIDHISVRDSTKQALVYRPLAGFSTISSLFEPSTAKMEKLNTVLTIPRPGEVKLVERPYPRIVPGYVLVKTVIAPVCIEHQIYRDHTFEKESNDSEHLGHEGVGEVVEVTEGSRFEVGDRVIVYQGRRCGKCLPCLRGYSPTHCELHGKSGPDRAHYSHERACSNDSGGFAFAKYRTVPEDMLQNIPDGLSFRHAAAANCACGCTFTAVETLAVQSGDHVLVAGIGFIGFGIIINALYRKATVIVLGRNEYRMDICRKLGAQHIVNPDDPDWHDQVLEITGFKRGADHAFECSGYPYYQQRCLTGIRQYGGIYSLGFIPGSSERYPVHVLDDILNKHATWTGGHDVDLTHRDRLLSMILDDAVQEKINLMVTHEFPMSRANEAFEVGLTKKCGKIYLYPHEDCPV